VPSYAHKKLIELISKLDELPSDPAEYADWIQAGGHLSLLRANANADDTIVYASADYTFIHSLLVPNRKLSRIDHGDLLKWSCNAYNSIASYVLRGGRNDVSVERGLSHTGTDTLKGATQLVFGRTFEGWTGAGGNYLELHQEYAHLAGIHWRVEERGYCRFNEHGDLEPIVSITNREDKGSSLSLVSFKWQQLEEYLIATKSSLVRMFYFTLLDRSKFGAWPEGPEEQVRESDRLFYKRKIDSGHAAYTRGVQIINGRRKAGAVRKGMMDRWSGRQDQQYVEFIAHDWRNKRITKISTDPNASSNFFAAKDNNLPFELSPAFFRPEVLLKYKGDRDKYTVGEREVSCRAAWHLKGIDVNEAGQIHAYICDLRDLPYSEQLHWLAFNEEPKTGISKRAIKTDFEGQFSDISDPLGKIRSTLLLWQLQKVSWWTLRERNLMDRVSTPVTSSRDEWAEAFMDLAKLVVEGFETKAIRARLDQERVPYGQEDKTIALLERLLNRGACAGTKLEGFRLVQHLRSKVKGHVGGSDAEALAQQAVTEHETFGKHFKYVCQIVVDDLETVERLFS
jgi:hypothetical protein